MSSKRQVKVAVVQTLAELGDVAANIDIVRGYAEKAAADGADLVVFPECMNSGYLFDDADHCRRVAEDLDGPYVSALRGLARDLGLHIVSGMTEHDPADDGIYNSSVLLDPSGKVAGHYRKQFLATHDRNWFEVGNRGNVVVDTAIGRIGLLICFDGRIPEIARSLSLAGAEMIVDVANFFEMDQADQWVPARAYENGVWIVASTKAGVERSIYYPGGSMIVGPDGVVRESVGRDLHGLAIAEIDLGAAADKAWPGTGGDRVADRRPECYSVLNAPFDATPAARLLPEPLVPEDAAVPAAVIQDHATAAPGSLAAAIEMVEHTARLGSRLLVLPLAFAVGTATPGRADVVAAQDAQDAALASIAAICAGYGAVAVVPLAVPNSTGFDHLVSVLGPDGREIRRVAQAHPEPGHGGTPGTDGLCVVDTPRGRLGVLVGYDGMFPEASRVLALLGAEIIVWPCAWRTGLERRLLTVTKAEDNRCFLLAANRSDAPSPGGSIVVTPLGLPSADVDAAVPPVTRHGAVLPGYLNRALARQKAMIPEVDMLRCRIPETYGPLVEAAR
ncbi:carbon-nitrogen hydrolase family protein [Actinomadura sp. WMMB 499]|uniref:carbon-nitrogen hydrolase family protein n=1 Tax=Actinomadura sp. WMMB 499 TaxID=1219491 RepID=UPI001248DE3A|nr:carbon-nitrogen hydrolase family protein [Actinomadura sp. WMMB 499]QFG22585.1 carbon-nitrogen hydrolase family protein [Actinomadura sp. WMMB 499]